MFGETTIFYIKIWNHPIETTIYKWLALGFQVQITQMSYTFPSCLLGTSMIGIQKIPRRICWTLKIACCSFRTRTGSTFAFLTPFMCWIFVSTKGIYMKPSEFGDVLKLRHSDWMIFWCSYRSGGLRPSRFFWDPHGGHATFAAPNGERLKNEFAQSQTLRTKKVPGRIMIGANHFFFGENQNIWEQNSSAFWKQSDPPGRYVRVLSKNSAKQPYGSGNHVGVSKNGETPQNGWWK